MSGTNMRDRIETSVIRFSGEKMKTGFTCIRAIVAETTLFNLSLYGFGRIQSLSILAGWMHSVSLPSLLENAI